MEYLRPNTMKQEEQEDKSLWEHIKSLVAQGLVYFNEDGELSHKYPIPPAKDINDGDK